MTAFRFRADLRLDPSIVAWAVTWAHGVTERHESYDAACAAVRSVYSAAEIGHDGDCTEGGDSTYCWPTELDSIDDDDDVRWCARIRPCWGSGD